MKLLIFSSIATREYDITYLEVETSVGNFVILEGHAPLLLILKAQEPIIFSRITSPESHEKEILPHGGILKVERDIVRLVAIT